MCERHNKVLVIRFDVRYPIGFPCQIDSNGLVSRFIERLVAGYTYHGIDCMYVWVREAVGSENPHYHFMVLIDGAKIQSANGIFQDAQRIWGNILRTDATGLIDHCQHQHEGHAGVNPIMIRRPSSLASGEELLAQQYAYDQASQYALFRGSYLAKTLSKGHAPYRGREFGSSQF